MELYSYPYRQKTFPYKHTKVFRSKICFNSVKRVRNRHFKIFYLKLRRQNRRHENCKSNVFHTAKLNLRVSLERKSYNFKSRIFTRWKIPVLSFTKYAFGRLQEIHCQKQIYFLACLCHNAPTPRIISPTKLCPVNPIQKSFAFIPRNNRLSWQYSADCCCWTKA